MLCRIALGAVALALAACTELPARPDGGGAGGTGADGAMGGSGGTGGDAGTGGTGGDVLCSRILLEEYADLEEGDVLQQQAAIGQVEGFCPGVPCDGADPIDRWSVTTCGGSHKVRLYWDEPTHNLNLFLYSPDDSQSWSSQSMDGGVELLTEELTTDQLYIIQVQAADTKGNAQAYDVTVTQAK